MKKTTTYVSPSSSWCIAMATLETRGRGRGSIGKRKLSEFLGKVGPAHRVTEQE
jgi:hypothetical protein